MSGYVMFIDDVQMPVTPGKLQLKIKGKNKTVTLVNDGEINFLKLPGLTEITVPLLLPMLQSYGYDFLHPNYLDENRNRYGGSAYKSPDYYLGIFEKLIAEMTPARFILSRTSPDGRRLYDTNIKVSIESYTVDEDAANGMDVAISLTMKQYRDFGTKTVRIIEPAVTPAATAPVAAPVAVVEKPREIDNAPKSQTYTVVRGDTLWGIAQKYYGNGAQYTKIHEANRDKVSNPNVIQPGQVLVIP